MSTAHAYDEGFAPHGGEVADRGGATSPKRSRSVKVVRPSGRFDDAAAGGSAAGEAVVGNRSDVSRRFERRRAESGSRRWTAFLDLAEARGVSAEEVAARFTADDVADLCAPEHDATMLTRCMDTLAAAIRRDLAASIVSSCQDDGGRHDGRAAIRHVRCADCRHFRRRASHPHLGDCVGGEPRTAASGFWDDQQRGCGTFAPSGSCPPVGESERVGAGTAMRDDEAGQPRSEGHELHRVRYG